MNNTVLFNTNVTGNEITTEDLYNALKKVKADECELLFIHTELSAFGIPNPKLKRKEFLGAIYDVILSLNIKTIIFPAFTFSFANDENFSVNESTAKYMGALNEYVRKQPNVVRSLDPMMSVIAVGARAEEFYNVGKQCMGVGGMFSKLHNIPHVKFLFLGAKPTHCFTYAHYVEGLYGVPYRYEHWFTGTITDREGNTYTDSYSLLAGCKGIYPAAMLPFEKQMIANNGYSVVQAGEGEIVCFNEQEAYKAMWAALDENIHGFLTKPFVTEDLVHEIKSSNGNRVVMVP